MSERIKKIRTKPTRPDLKKKNLSDKEEIAKIKYFVNKLLEIHKIEVDW